MMNTNPFYQELDNIITVMNQQETGTISIPKSIAIKMANNIAMLGASAMSFPIDKNGTPIRFDDFVNLEGTPVKVFMYEFYGDGSYILHGKDPDDKIVWKKYSFNDDDVPAIYMEDSMEKIKGDIDLSAIEYCQKHNLWCTTDEANEVKNNHIFSRIKDL